MLNVSGTISCWKVSQRASRIYNIGENLIRLYPSNHCHYDKMNGRK